jgi:hypothetical protein
MVFDPLFVMGKDTGLLPFRSLLNELAWFYCKPEMFTRALVQI